MKKFRMLSLLFVLVIAVGVAAVQSQSSKRNLDIFYIDVEGGAATLIVTPAGESVLVDAGWPGFDGRDAKRIEIAMKAAGISQIDHLVMTHYHVDHFGGIPELARRVKVGKFYDHGPMQSLDEDKNFAEKNAAYQAATKGQSVTLTPGSEIKLKQAPGTPEITLQCLSTRGEIPPSKVKATPSAECTAAAMQAEDKSDNARSVVLLLRYGAFDFLDSGDLTWNIEHKLVCPRNLIGEVDLYQVAHHGLNTSNNPLLLRTIKPTVAIMNNGARKGGSPETIKALRELPSLKGLWQVHRNVALAADQNAPADFIANPEEQNDAAFMLRVAVDAAKKSFTVTNARNGKSESYPIK
ncbi:MAG TPA: MBL fold metallo-hydrolase [Blastocatellia bacterium]|nr:MBL fold metallo-hydrolase [Blastocatellia bacterium]HMY75135.1 MBL fold metallo-hydrolase [Blastocatellia bacterium]HMZ19706.1 MBL fold metallo-hydrolase [Blastocatellia bacterium]HNG29516.1 MBL fold metallo-hydrolase [Blastocatellia bacterium]